MIITSAGQLKVTDFGIARIESAALTQVTSTIGTPGYMAPEQYVGESFDHRVDIFAAGVLLYRMLAGQPPFSGSAGVGDVCHHEQGPHAASSIDARRPGRLLPASR
ncbi:MAG: protein kinase [Rhodoferax sp.]|nr:protein kinase [Rhodoferax sp.]